MNDIISILNRLDESIYKLSCSAQSIEIRIRDDLMKTLSIIPNPFDSCRIAVDELFPGHNLRWKPLSWYQPNELYELRKCYTESALTPTTPIQSILMAYRDMEFLAAEMRCLSIAFAATMNLKYYIKEMGKISALIDVYEPYESVFAAQIAALPNDNSEIADNENLRFLRAPIKPLPGIIGIGGGPLLLPKNERIDEDENLRFLRVPIKPLPGPGNGPIPLPFPLPQLP